ncbi:hypothetical protein EXIGLDRAFT_646774 [Exidia glandulosa HHB12029]|uniref:Fe2OG dioxygenase domain-containing protein n=1 Tax=Exidia glandulosa HHB12029 TaxID=1314781 RepID=A0A165I466_EXIGL|nr:hypothetical protein EXIGLDRAFT_646774 [Exidia glandulosa HHB12029]
MSIHALLQEALSQAKPFYGEGVCTIPDDLLNLFIAKEPYRWSLCKDGATDVDLQRLAAACEPATFGMNQNDVLDESYRKAGKLDRKDFSINLDVVSTGLLQAVHSALFGWEDKPRNIQAELYKLNVYGPGSFFKPHKDTPRARNMFGSLVVNFPTTYEGGALVLRHDGREHVHDPSAVPYTSANQVAWAAFYSDVEHEVLPVLSGYRVTLTYNLYFSDDSHAPPAKPPFLEPLVSAFRQVMNDDSFRNGGRLGFGLNHQYAVRVDGIEDCLDNLSEDLKGIDRALFQAAQAAGLYPALRLAYEIDNSGTYLFDHVLAMPDQVENWSSEMVDAGGEMIACTEDHVERDVQMYLEENAIEWVTPRTSSHTLVEDHCVWYGNQPSIEYVYAHLVLIASVPSKDGSSEYSD